MKFPKLLKTGTRKLMLGDMKAQTDALITELKRYDNVDSNAAKARTKGRCHADLFEGWAGAANTTKLAPRHWVESNPTSRKELRRGFE